MIKFGSEENNIFTMPFLIQELEERDNALKLRIAFPKKGTIEGCLSDTSNSIVKDIFEASVPIYEDENEIYEILFDSYIFHITRNESYTGLDERDDFIGKYFVIYENSKLLKLMPQLVEYGLIEALYPEGCVHYGIFCQNHIIDIITSEKPKIVKIR